MKTAKDGKFPLTVSEGRVTAKIHKVTKLKNGKTYVSYVADYVLLGKRKQTVRANFEEAKQIALDACRQIAGGQQISLTLANGDRLAYLRANESLSLLSIPLDVAAQEYAAAFQILGGKASVVEACRDWIKRYSTACPRISVPAAVELFKQEAETDKKSDERRKQFRNVLERFAENFSDEVHTITPGLISSHLGAREWQATGSDCTYFLSQHRKMGCDVILVTQHPEQTDKALRRLAQEYMTVRNLSREPVFGFRIANFFRYIRTLNSPSSPNPGPFESGFIRLKPEVYGKLYDSRSIATTNAASEETSQTWNAKSQLIDLIDSAGHTSIRGYDAAGNQIILTNHNGKVWQFYFDGANRLTNTVSPLGRSTMVAFNHQGLLTSKQDPADNITTCGYDAKERLTNRADSFATTLYARKPEWSPSSSRKC